jgi:hypothetical protein
MPAKALIDAALGHIHPMAAQRTVGVINCRRGFCPDFWRDPNSLKDLDRAVRFYGTDYLPSFA